MNDCQREQVRRYKEKLESMTEFELAQEGMRHLKFSIGVWTVSFVLLSVCAFVLPVDGMVIFMLLFLLVAIPFLAIEFFSLRPKLKGGAS